MRNAIFLFIQAVAGLLFANVAKAAYVTPPTFRTTWVGVQGNEDKGITYLDLNDDHLPDILQAFDIAGTHTLQSWINNGCEFVDSSTFNETSKLKMCSIPMIQPYALQDDDVSSFLKQLKLVHYVDTFANHEIDFETLLELTNDDLKDMGIEAVGARKRILRGLSRMSSN